VLRALVPLPLPLLLLRVVRRAPVERAPPVERLPVARLPVEPLPVEPLPVERLPVERLPVERLPVERPPVEPLPAERPPVERLPVVRRARPPPDEPPELDPDPDPEPLLLACGMPCSFVSMDARTLLIGWAACFLLPVCGPPDARQVARAPKRLGRPVTVEGCEHHADRAFDGRAPPDM
jgi:hypothetical protein